MKKWLFVALALILMPVAVLFAGCSTKDKEVVIRVKDDYVQWAYVGEDEWTNVISIEDIKNALGESYQGEKENKVRQELMADKSSSRKMKLT